MSLRGIGLLRWEVGLLVSGLHVDPSHVREKREPECVQDSQKPKCFRKGASGNGFGRSRLT